MYADYCTRSVHLSQTTSDFFLEYSCKSRCTSKQEAPVESINLRKTSIACSLIQTHCVSTETTNRYIKETSRSKRSTCSSWQADPPTPVTSLLLPPTHGAHSSTRLPNPIGELSLASWSPYPPFRTHLPLCRPDPPPVSSRHSSRAP